MNGKNLPDLRKATEAFLEALKPHYPKFPYSYQDREIEFFSNNTEAYDEQEIVLTFYTNFVEVKIFGREKDNES